MELHKIDDNLGVDFNEARDTIGLYDTRAYSPQVQTVLTGDQLWEIIKLYVDGRCPYCFDEIPEGHLVCRGCAEKAAKAWGIT